MYTVKEVCNITGLSRKSVLYYDNVGLVHPSQRSETRYRLYSMEDVEKLKVIRNLRSIELSIEEIRHLFSSEITAEEIRHIFNYQRNHLLLQSNNYYVLAKKLDYIENDFELNHGLLSGGERGEKQKNALLVFNMENDFIYGGLRSESVADILHPLRNMIVTAWRYNIPIIHIMDSHPDKRNAGWELWGEHAKEGTAGADMIDMLRDTSYEYVIKKQGYSAVYNTKLDDVLRFWEIETLFLCGVYAEVAINQSTMDAYNRGYHIFLVEDCIAGHKKSGLESTMANLSSFCEAQIIQSRQIPELFCPGE